MGNWSLITYYCAITMILIAYVLGSIPSAVWIGKKYYGVDIREHGSKNAGTTNMLRVLGRRAAVPVFVLDFFKGFVAVSIITLMRYDADVSSAWLINLKILGVFAAVLGHIFPVFADFKGGKGVATLVGAITGIYPQIVFLCFAVWVLVFMISHYVSLASITAGCCFPLFVIVYSRPNGRVTTMCRSLSSSSRSSWRGCSSGLTARISSVSRLEPSRRYIYGISRIPIPRSELRAAARSEKTEKT